MANKSTQANGRLSKAQLNNLQKMVVYCLKHLEVESEKRMASSRKGLRVLSEFIPHRSFGWLSYAAKGRWDQIAPTKADYETMTTVYKTVLEFTKRGRRISRT